MKLFLDTNILVDFIIERRPHSVYAYKILVGAKSNQFQLWSSGNSFVTTHYLVHKKLGDKKTRRILAFLLKYIGVVDGSKSILMAAIESNFSDFEDAVQYNCAKKIEDLDFIITRDPKGFKHSSILIKSPEELFI